MFNPSDNTNGFYPNKQTVKFSQTVVDNFAPGHGWSKGASGTISDDTSVHLSGSQSLKMVTAGTGSNMTITKTYGAGVDISNGFVKVRVMVDSYVNLSELSLYIANESGFTNWIIQNLGAANSGQTYNYLQPNVWTDLIVDLGMAQVGGGSFDPTNALTWRIRLNDQHGVPVTCWVNQITYISNPQQGIVVITADDGWESQYTAMRPIMSKYNFPATLYLIPDNFGQIGFLTHDEINEMQAKLYWEMGMHHQTDLVDYMNTNGPAATETLIKNIINYGKKYGFNGANHFAYPEGGVNQELIEIMERYFATGRGIIYGQSDTLPNLEHIPLPDPFKLQAYDVRNTQSPTLINSLLDRIETYGAIGIFNFHKIVTTSTDPLEYTIANFTTIIDYLATKNVQVMTMGQLYQWLTNGESVNN